MDDNAKKDTYLRIISYMRPQWFNVLMVFFWSLVIAMMFSVSFMTILPLLKVMMNEEGLHNWSDRLTVQWRYGVTVAIPDLAQAQSGNTNAVRIIGLDKEALATEAGLKQYDVITAVEYNQVLSESYSDKLMSLADASGQTETDTITVHYGRVVDGQPQKGTLQLPIARYETAEGLSFPKRLDWGLKWKAAEGLRWLLHFLPRNADKMKAIIFIIVGMSIVTFFRCLARFYQEYLGEKVVSTTVASIREDLFQHTMHLPVGFFTSQGTSDTTTRLLNNVTVCGAGLRILLGKALREPLKAVGTLTGAMMISWQLTLIFIAAAPFTIGAFAILGTKIRKGTKRSMESSAAMLGRIQGAMNALSVVKVYNRQSYEIEKYHDANHQLLKRILHVAKISTFTHPLMEILGMLAGSSALIVGAVWVSKGQLQGSDFLTMLIMLGTSAESIRKVSDIWNAMQTANAAGDRVFAVIDEPVEKETPNAFELAPLRNAIEFKDIVFTYPGANRPALNHLNLTVRAGHNVAIVGANGSGKSTLINLIPRFYDPDSGRILIDGQDIHQATLHSLRDQIGLVTQKVITFNDTIFNNIAYGKPGATMDEVVAAAKKAFAHEFIEPLDDGYQTFIGENNAGFSGGQLQRIVIARAILKDPQILIFDEAMSQIDADSEMKIHQSLSQLMKGRTSFLIAHRFSTVITADTIVVIDQGQVIAEGTHDQLVKTCDTYQRLYETQLLGG